MSYGEGEHGVGTGCGMRSLDRSTLYGAILHATLWTTGALEFFLDRFETSHHQSQSRDQDGR